MAMVQHSAKFIQKRKLAMVFPLFAGVASCLIFWILDGGSKEKPNASKDKAPIASEINANVDEEAKIDANLNENLASKLNHQEIKQQEIEGEKEALEGSIVPIKQDKILAFLDKDQKDNEDKELYDSPFLEKKNNVKEKKEEPLEEEKPVEKKTTYKKPSKLDRELEAYYKKYNQKGAPSNKNSEEEDGLQEDLSDDTDDKANALVKEKSPLDTSKKIPKAKIHNDRGINTLSNHLPNASYDNFYTIGHPIEDFSSHMAKAVVHQSQELADGEELKLRLLSNININGRIIPKNTVIHGTIKLGGSRIAVSISSIVYKDTIIPFRGAIYDRDGKQGINILGGSNQGREIASGMIDQVHIQPLQFQSVQNVQHPNQPGFFQVVKPDFQKQILYDGVRSVVNATKEFVKSKIMNKRVHIQANHLVYLDIKTEDKK